MSEDKNMTVEEVLNKAGMGHLVERFVSENIDISTIFSISDQDLARLGVSTIGNRIRLREVCKQQQQQLSNNRSASAGSAAAVAPPLPTPTPVAGPSNYSQIIRERAGLFSGKRKKSRTSSQGGGRVINKKQNITR